MFCLEKIACKGLTRDELLLWWGIIMLFPTPYFSAMEIPQSCTELLIIIMLFPTPYFSAMKIPRPCTELLIIIMLFPTHYTSAMEIPQPCTVLLICSKVAMMFPASYFCSWLPQSIHSLPAPVPWVPWTHWLSGCHQTSAVVSRNIEINGTYINVVCVLLCCNVCVSVSEKKFRISVMNYIWK